MHLQTLYPSSIIYLLCVYFCPPSTLWKLRFFPLSTASFSSTPFPQLSHRSTSSSLLSLDNCSLPHLIYAKPFMPLECFSSLNTSRCVPKHVSSKPSVFWYRAQKRSWSLVWFENWYKSWEGKKKLTNVGKEREEEEEGCLGVICKCVCLSMDCIQKAFFFTGKYVQTVQMCVCVCACKRACLPLCVRISTKMSVLISVTQREVLTPALCSGGRQHWLDSGCSDESICNSYIISRSTHCCTSNSDGLYCFMQSSLSSQSSHKSEFRLWHQSLCWIQFAGIRSKGTTAIFASD